MRYATILLVAIATSAHAAPPPRGPDFVPAHPHAGVDQSLAMSHGTSIIAPSDEVLFAPGSAALDDTARIVLDDAAHWLHAHRHFSLAVEGHAEPQANADATETLAERRAEAVRAYLASRGIKGDRVVVLVSGAPGAHVALFASDRPIADVAADAIDARGELVVRWTDRGTRFEEEPGLGVRASRAIATRR